MSFSIFPRKVFEVKSKISGEIVVQEQLGLYTLHVQNLIQSGGIVKGIWKKALHYVQGKPFVSGCLVLGLGGGTVVQLVKSHSSNAEITGVEIDPEIIKIGKKYFGLGEVDGLKIIQADAFNFNNIYYRSQYDLIVVDLYLGKKFPVKAASDEFLKKIKNLLLPEGTAIFNRLRTGKELGSFEKKLKNHFSRVNLVKTSTNLFFLVRV
ncbi:MAG TPA: methyltransferase domain-containing protein [Nevskiaceae bacterium]|nr:methyltransferase domain-containing protein [Nevskiaceae bacterium]